MMRGVTRRRGPFVFAIVAAALGLTAGAAAAEPVTVERVDEGLRVEIDGELFTMYQWNDVPKPLFYPVHGPEGRRMVRHYPFKDVEGESEDHPHQQSLWYGHGNVNGVDFWHTPPEEGYATIEQASLLETISGRGEAGFRARNRWLDPEGELVCTETRRVLMGTTEDGGRYIDLRATMHAPEDEELTFGDTKEGTMGIRTHPNLRLDADPDAGIEEVSGQAINSEGTSGKPVWGERAKWIDYWGQVDGQIVGVAIFDHPSNPRHPTWWHARGYGLVAANPFGVSYFDDEPEGTGDLTVEAGDEITFRYRFLFHEGDHEEAEVEKRYEEFAASDAQ